KACGGNHRFLPKVRRGLFEGDERFPLPCAGGAGKDLAARRLAKSGTSEKPFSRADQGSATDSQGTQGPGTLRRNDFPFLECGGEAFIQEGPDATEGERPQTVQESSPSNFRVSSQPRPSGSRRRRCWHFPGCFCCKIG